MQNTKFLTQKEKQLIEKAKQHIKKAYKKDLTSIAAVLTTKQGRVYTGINLKYKKIWKCVCAEKVAIAKAIEQGETDFDMIVSVKYEQKNNSFSVINMCGECRQIAICYPHLKAIVDNKGVLQVVPIQKTLPFPYI